MKTYYFLSGVDEATNHTAIVSKSKPWYFLCKSDSSVVTCPLVWCWGFNYRGYCWSTQNCWWSTSDLNQIFSSKSSICRHNAHSCWDPGCCIIFDWTWAVMFVHLQNLQQKETDGYRASWDCLMSYEHKSKSSISRENWPHQIRLFMFNKGRISALNICFCVLTMNESVWLFNLCLIFK